MKILTTIMSFLQAHLNILAPVYVLIEYWLGRTDLVKAGSVVQLILNGLAKGLQMVGADKPAA